MAEGRWQHNGIRYGALREALLKEAPPPETASFQKCPTLRHLIAACGAVSTSNAPLSSTLEPGSNGSNHVKNNGAIVHGVHPPPAPQFLLPDGSAFLGALDGEMGRVQRCVAAFAEELWLRLLAMLPQLPPLPEEEASHTGEGEHLATPALSPVEEANIQELLWRCDGIGEELVRLDHFIRSNSAAAAHLAEARDSSHSRYAAPAQEPPDSEAELQPLYLAVIRECIVGEVDPDAVLVGLGDVYEHLRTLLPEPEPAREEGEDPEEVEEPEDSASLTAERAGQRVPEATTRGGECAANGVWVPPDIFERKSIKFWVKPAMVARVQSEIVKHLPVLVFGRAAAGKLTGEGGSAAQLQSLAQQTVHAASRVSSVYLDDPRSLATYRDRLHREHNASVVRLRWYGEQRRDDPFQTIWAERKIHRERWTGQRSIKERAAVEQRHVSEFVAGSGGPPEMGGKERPAELLRDMQAFITSRRQGPVLRTSCARTAFQRSDGNALRVSLDCGLSFTREGLVAHSSGSGWDEWLAPPAERDVVRFPYTVLELKLSISVCPLWVTELIAAGAMLEVPMFSKFLHGTAVLYPERCLEAPYWFLPAEGGTLSPATYDEMTETADVYLKDSPSWAFPNGFAMAPEPNSGSSRRTRLLSFFRRAGDISRPALPPIARQAAIQKLLAPAGGCPTMANGATHSLPVPALRTTSARASDCGPATATEGAVNPPPVMSAALQEPVQQQNPLAGAFPGAAHSHVGQAQGSATSAVAVHTPEQHVPGLASGLFTFQAAAVVRQLRAQHVGSDPLDPGPGKGGCSDGCVKHVPIAGAHELKIGHGPASETLNPNTPEKYVAGQGDVVINILPAVPATSTLPNGSAALPLAASGTSTLRSSTSTVDGGDLESAITPYGGVPLLAAGAYSSTGGEVPVKGERKRLLRNKVANWIAGKRARVDEEKAALPPTNGTAEPAAHGDREEGEGARQSLARWVRNPSGSSSSKNQRAKALVRTRVEPKVFFANERTFLAWLHIAVLIMFIALSLLGGSTISTSQKSSSGSGCAPGDSGCTASKIAGLVIAPVAFIFVLYALFMYKKRTRQILRREKVRYDDQRGPVLLVVLLACALIVATVLTANSALGHHLVTSSSKGGSGAG